MNQFFPVVSIYISKGFSAFDIELLIINITRMYLAPLLYNAHIRCHRTILVFCASLQHLCSINPIFLGELVSVRVITKFMDKFCSSNSQDCIVCKWINASEFPMLVYLLFKQYFYKD